MLLFFNEDLWTGDFPDEHYAAARKFKSFQSQGAVKVPSTSRSKRN